MPPPPSPSLIITDKYKPGAPGKPREGPGSPGSPGKAPGAPGNPREPNNPFQGSLEVPGKPAALKTAHFCKMWLRENPKETSAAAGGRNGGVFSRFA